MSDEELADLGFQGSVQEIERVINADPTIVGESFTSLNMTLLHCAASSDQGDVAARVELLLARGSDPNAKGHLGRTPLCFAVESSGQWTHRVVSLLLEKGADPRIANDFGYDSIETARVQQLPELDPIIAILQRRADELNAQ